MQDVGGCEFGVPELEAPVHAKLEVRLEGTEISNAWDFWFFPKRAERRGDGIAVTEDLHEALASRYRGIAVAGTPEGESARFVIGSWDHPALLDAAARGTRGLMIGPAEGAPNVRLGWWWLGNQLGTVFADHPVFGSFPHDGKLSPLWFRLIKEGLPLPIAPEYGEFTHLAVGEGQKQYFTYVCQKKDDAGRQMLITRGVDLLADTPEGAYLLDAMIDYALSDAFAEALPAKPKAVPRG